MAGWGQVLLFGAHTPQGSDAAGLVGCSKLMRKPAAVSCSSLIHGDAAGWLLLQPCTRQAASGLVVVVVVMVVVVVVVLLLPLLQRLLLHLLLPLHLLLLPLRLLLLLLHLHLLLLLLLLHLLLLLLPPPPDAGTRQGGDAAPARVGPPRDR